MASNKLGRAGQGRAGQGRAGHRAGQGRAEQGWSQGRAGQGRAGQGRSDCGSASRDDLYSSERQQRPGHLDESQRQISSEDLVT